MNKYIIQRFFVLLLYFIYVTSLSAYNLRRISNDNGLSNSAVLSLCQDYRNFMWMGTCDGLHFYDGITATLLNLSQGCLSGSVIEDLLETENGIIWVLTNYGLDCVDVNRRVVTCSFDLIGGRRLKKNAQDQIFVIGENNSLYYVCLATNKLKEVEISDIQVSTLLDIYVTDTFLWTFSDKGIWKTEFDIREDKIYTVKKNKLIDAAPLQYAFVSESIAYIVDEQGNIYECDLINGRKEKLFYIGQELMERGKISDIIAFQNSYFIAFQTNGLIKAVKHNEKYCIEDLGILSGIFRLQKDKKQNLVWIGTDGEGTYVYSDGKYSVKSYSFADMGIYSTKPIRAIFLDKDHNLWLGTKGAGLFKIQNFNINKKILPNQSRQFLSQSEKWEENVVYAFENSTRPLFWIGTDAGLLYYSYMNKKIIRAPCNVPIHYIHGLYEENDSILWISTVGTGVVKARIVGSRAHPRLEVIKQYTIEEGAFPSNFFFALTPHEDGRILFGNRGYGLFSLKDDKMYPIPLINDYRTPIVKDVISVKHVDGTIWIGTNYGLIMQRGKKEKRFGRSNGFPNNVIHAIEIDNGGDLWLSTNRGLLRFNRENYNFQCYNSDDGLSVTEYADGASLRTQQGCLLFGGINGLTLVKENPAYKDENEYQPPISFLELSIQGEQVNLYNYLVRDERNSLELAYNQNTFRILYAIPNYIDMRNCEYYYRIGNNNSKWISNGNQNLLSFVQMAVGDYTVYVKYKNRVTGTESKTYQLHIRILPPWYLNSWMKSFYILVAVLSIFFIIRRILNKQERTRLSEIERMEREHRDEVYEEKLRFFTNITHEFCTPLTLIYGPCECILNYGKSDSLIKKYASLIKDNADRLNNLIEEVIEFRRLETGHKVRTVSNFSVNSSLDKITPSFVELAKRNQVNFSLELHEDTLWSTDVNCFEKILINLISNAFKYTSLNGSIQVKISIENEQLRLAVYNTGKGIKDEDKERIFNRYSILDSIEENRIGKLSTRNGLGLAICYSMVELLEGRIEVESKVEQYAEFIVFLPWLNPTSKNDIAHEQPITIVSENLLQNTVVGSPSKDENKYDAQPDGQKRHILVIDDNEDILLLLQETLAEYRLSVARNAEEGLKFLKEDMPDLIITDIMMPGINGIELARQIKGYKHTMHIPLIILSAKHTIDEQVEGIASGADAYISKPFSLIYLKAVINRLIINQSVLKEYYNSSAGAYEFARGKLLSKEDKKMVESVICFVNNNIDNADLGAEDLAEHLGVSVRALYRKLKDLSLPTPKDFIKEQKMALAVKLLQTTTLNVQEIIYQCGFNNRSYFYKEFAKKYGCSPKEYRMANKQKGNE